MSDLVMTTTRVASNGLLVAGKMAKHHGAVTRADVGGGNGFSRLQILGAGRHAKKLDAIRQGHLNITLCRVHGHVAGFDLSHIARGLCGRGSGGRSLLLRAHLGDEGNEQHSDHYE